MDRNRRHVLKAGLGATALFAPLRELTARLDPERFVQIHRSTLVNLDHVESAHRDEQGRVKCVACYMCSTACPARCIDLVAAPSPWPDREKYPETFVIDKNGTIRYKQIGPVTAEVLERKILPMIRELQKS